MKKTTLFLSVLILCTVSISWAQINSTRESIRLVDAPTAGVLKRGSYAIETRMYTEGGLLSELSVGVFRRFMIGLSFGGSNIIGNGYVNWNPHAGYTVRYQLFRESYNSPAVTLGFDSQGYGLYDKSVNRYEVKSRGFFISASRNYLFLGRLGLHGGANFSLENEDQDDDLTFFVGINKSINSDISVIGEYDIATNDNRTISFGSGKGYFNAGLRFSVSRHLSIEVDFRDILRNKENLTSPNREIKIVYIESF